VSSLNQIYLDYAAATPVDPRVQAAMVPYFYSRFFNPSSPYAPALEVRHEYEAAKAALARTFGGKTDEIVITAGATESINLAFQAVDGHVVVGAIEHPAVLEAAKSKSSYTIIQPNEKGIVTVESIKNTVQPDTQLVSVQIANNEIGTVQPLREISHVIVEERQKRIAVGNMTPLLFHTDASQGFGQLDIHVARLGVDMMTLNSGKMYGPKGVGLLWSRPAVKLKPLIVGGGQERGLRSGTENVAGVIGFSIAAEIATEQCKNEHKRLERLRNILQEKLLEEFPEIIISGHQKKRLAGHLHISFPNIDGERLLFMLETKGVLVATGSACAANKGLRSHVLTAIGLNPEIADGSLRITLGRYTTEENVHKAAARIIEVVHTEYARTRLLV